jgi:hypothetical protein
VASWVADTLNEIVSEWWPVAPPGGRPPRFPMDGQRRAPWRLAYRRFERDRPFDRADLPLPKKDG